MSSNQPSVISFWKFSVRTDYAAIFLATYEFYYFLKHLNAFTDLELLFDFFLVLADLVGIILFFASLYTKNPWLILPLIITYIFGAYHYIVDIVTKYVVALFPERFGENYWGNNIYSQILNSRKLKERYVNECVAKAAVELPNLLLIIALIFLYCKILQDMRSQRAVSHSEEENDIEIGNIGEDQNIATVSHEESTVSQDDEIFCTLRGIKIKFSLIVVVLALFETAYTFSNITNMGKIESSIERYMTIADIFCLVFLFVGLICSNPYFIVPILFIYSVETAHLLAVTLIDFSVANFPIFLGKYYWDSEDYDGAMNFDVMKERLMNKCIAEGTVHFIELVFSASLTFCYFRIAMYLWNFRPAETSEQQKNEPVPEA